MPPAKRAPAVQQCAFKEGRRRCARNATDRSGFCRAHKLVMEGVAQKTDARGGSVRDLASRVMHDLFRGKKMDVDKTASDLTDAIFGPGGSFVDFRPDTEDINWDEMFGKARATADRIRQGARQARQVHQQYRQQQTVDPQVEAARLEGIRARAALGFGPQDLITKESLKARHRELAKKHHPDRGGSVDAMQRVNAAVDVLAAQFT